MRSSVLILCATLILALFAGATASEASAQEMVGGAEVLTAEEHQQEEQAGDIRGIRTLQRRLFAKFGRLEFSLSAGIMPNDPFVFYMPAGLRVGYHFNEAFAIELSGAYLGDGLRIESALRDELAETKRDRTRIDDITLLDQQVMRASLVAMWSPIFGKVAVMNDGLVHFDFNIVGGAGFLLTQSPDAINPDETLYNPTAEAILGAGFKFYFGGRFAIRADFRQYIYAKSVRTNADGSESGGGTANPSEISLGFSVFTD